MLRANDLGASFLAFASRKRPQDRAPQVLRHDGGDPRQPGFWTFLELEIPAASRISDHENAPSGRTPR
jgi:hypothetical protein